jgi:hypothetical protein
VTNAEARELAKIAKRALTLKQRPGAVSEDDTRACVIDRIFAKKLLGWSVYDPDVVRRASRAHNRNEFDAEICKGSKLCIVREDKGLDSTEYNGHLLGSSTAVGALTALSGGKFDNRPGDGVGQLRRYCLARASSGQLPAFDPQHTVPVLTDGVRWSLFRADLFLLNPTQPMGRQHLLLPPLSFLDPNFFVDPNFFDDLSRFIGFAQF